MDLAEIRASDRGVRWPGTLRYHATMKRTRHKLVLRHETLRTLTNMDLSRALGGFDSGAEQCSAVPDSGSKYCESVAVIVATVVCR